MMDDVSSRVVRSRVEWAAVIEAQERSGESALQFCRERGIDRNQFFYRRKVLKKSDQSSAKRPPFGVAVSSREMSVPGGFIPIHVEEGASTTPPSIQRFGTAPAFTNSEERCSVRLRFPMGLVLESERVPSAAWVVEVARRWADGEESPC